MKRSLYYSWFAEHYELIIEALHFIIDEGYRNEPKIAARFEAVLKEAGPLLAMMAPPELPEGC